MAEHAFSSSQDSTPRPARATFRVVLADDHAILRAGLKVLIEGQPDMAVVAEAGDVERALDAVRTHRPDVLVLDLKMPGSASIPAIREVRALSPETRVLVLTMYDDPAFVQAATDAGAAGYLLKRSAYSALIEALGAVAQGRSFCDPALATRAHVPTADQASLSLTAREREVLALLAKGLTYKEAAARLFVSDRTIETHRRNVMEKLRLRSRADLLRYALENGLVDGVASEPPSS